MQILKLKLAGIGPYVAEQSIDFTRLGANGVFLLEGPTGAGKSTLIDAIVFALYGQVASKDSSAERMVSKHRKPADEPFVELVIETSRGIHRVRRTPQFTRPKQRGEGTTKVNATVKLWKLSDPDDARGEVISSNIQDAATELGQAVGLTREQFTQIVVLPQGHFAKFLEAKPEERRQLLQPIFGTQIFADVQATLIDMAKDSQAQIEQARAQLGAAMERFVHDADAPDPTDGGNTAETGPPDNAPSADDSADAEPTNTEPTVSLRDQLAALLAADDMDGLLTVAQERLDALTASLDDHQLKAAAADQHAAKTRALLDAGNRMAKLKTDLAELHEQEAVLAQRAAEFTAAEARLNAAVRAESWNRAGKAETLAATKLGEQRTAWEALAAEIQTGADAALLDGIDEVAERIQATRKTQSGGDTPQDKGAEKDRSTQKDQAPPHDPVPTLRKHADELRASSGALEQSARLEAGLPQCERQLDAQRVKLSELQALAASDDTHIAELTAERSSLAEQLEELGAADEELTKASLAKEQASQQLAAVRAVQADVTALESAREAELLATSQSEAARTQHQQARSQWLDGLAGTLAAQLQPGEACPVCGAAEHPHPAASAPDAVTRDDVTRLEALAGEAATSHAQAQARCNELAARVEERTADTKGLTIEQATDALAQADKLVGNAKQQIAHRQTLATKAAETGEELEQLRAHHAATLAEASRLSGAIDTATKQLASDRAQLAAERGDADSLADRLADVQRELANTQRIVDAMNRLSQAASELSVRSEEAAEALAQAGFDDPWSAADALLPPDELDELDAWVDKFRASRAWVSTRLSQPDMKEAAEAPAPDLDGLTAAAEQAADAQISAQQALGTARSVVQQSSAAFAELSGAVEALAQLAPKAAPVVRMAELAAAGQRSLSKVTLPTYVLLDRFEQVIDHANERLEAMTQGRYSLKRIDEKEGSGQKLGLGLAVVDHLPVDTERTPQSLSGGERFQASLAMALGLTDMVMAEAGGMSLDSLFVDEGFGGLDSASLDDVMDQLEGLRAGGRHVGVISHVAEMKQRIGERISVRKLPDGSSTLTTTLDE